MPVRGVVGLLTDWPWFNRRSGSWKRDMCIHMPVRACLCRFARCYDVTGCGGVGVSAGAGVGVDVRQGKGEGGRV